MSELLDVTERRAGVIFDADFDPTQELRRMAEVERQRVEEDRVGGGPRCPNCGNRSLYRMENDDRLKCRDCESGAVVIVAGGGIKVEQICQKAGLS